MELPSNVKNKKAIISIIIEKHNKPLDKMLSIFMHEHLLDDGNKIKDILCVPVLGTHTGVWVSYKSKLNANEFDLTLFIPDHQTLFFAIVQKFDGQDTDFFLQQNVFGYANQK